MHTTTLRPLARRIALSVSALALGAALLSGCGGSPDSMKGKSYGRDGQLGLTNTNPHLINTPHAQNIQQDANFAKQKAKEVQGVGSVRLVIDGATMRAYVTPSAGMNSAQREEMRARVQSQLAFNMPRYKVVTELAQ
ncbi:hypothetical protein HGI30_01250 [Paenibacillus albicereus]|uniref:Sporulation protein n=1 Tax=Paenibacillus albicereus TaxID=2726185 RepID=A0A6H2GSM7_9BACL|nr:hypothetical protein [Paenibacillus albicereus]QJC50359.1 hypothetical protein HGI30_01250 [Paenibacillus albicereus]